MRVSNGAFTGDLFDPAFFASASEWDSTPLFVTKKLHMAPFHAAEHLTHRFFAKLESNSGRCAKVEKSGNSLDRYESRYGRFARASKNSQLACGDITINMRDDALSWTRFKNRSL